LPRRGSPARRTQSGDRDRDAARQRPAPPKPRQTARPALAGGGREATDLAWKLCRASLNELAREFRRKDHTTIMYGCRKIRALTESDPRFNERMQKLLDAIIAVRRDLSENGFSEDDLRELVRS
jgi:hypothetical protein